MHFQVQMDESDRSDIYVLACNRPAHGLGEDLDEHNFNILCQIMKSAGVISTKQGNVTRTS